MSRMNIFIDNFFINHRNSDNHPESPERMLALFKMVEGYKVNQNIDIFNLNPNIEVDPAMVHNVDYLNYLRKNIPPEGEYYQLDEDTGSNSATLEVALAGLKMMQQGVDKIMSDFTPTFVMTIPPGHHARPGSSMGFCIFNNIAYAAKYARKQLGIQKILILDWDVHHFNGTEEMFYEDSNTLTISLHQFPHWPDGYGWVDRVGILDGLGYNMNITLPHEAGDKQVIEVFEKFIKNKINDFKPELILVSAGFDAHYQERKSTLGVPSVLSFSEYGYSWLTHQLQFLAAKYSKNRLMFVLEGGYYIPSLVSSSKAVIDTILNNQMDSEYSPTDGQYMDGKVWDKYIKEMSLYFKN